jgi:hypothetical protein
LGIGAYAGHFAARIDVQERAIAALGVNGRLRGLSRSIDIAGQQAGAGGQTGDDQYGGNQALQQVRFHQCSPTLQTINHNRFR